MKKLVRLFSILLFLVLAIPIFRNLCEKFRTCEAMRAYAIMTDRNVAFQGIT